MLRFRRRETLPFERSAGGKAVPDGSCAPSTPKRQREPMSKGVAPGEIRKGRLPPKEKVMEARDSHTDGADPTVTKIQKKGRCGASKDVLEGDELRMMVEKWQTQQGLFSGCVTKPCCM